MKQKIMWSLSCLLLALSLDAHAQNWGQVDPIASTYKQADVAADAASVAMSNFRSGVEQVTALDGKIREAKDQASKASSEQARLKAEKEQSLEDMRNGAFCRACHNTRSQVEAEGKETWQQHLNQYSGGVAIPATPEEIASKAKEYDDQITDAARKQALVEAQTLGVIHQSEQEREQVVQTVQKNMAIWRNAMQQEGPLYTSEFGIQKAKIELEVQEWQKTFKTLDQMEQRAQHPDSIGAPGQTSPLGADQQQIAQFESGKQSLRDQMRIASNEMDRLNDQYQLKQSAWANAVLEGQKAWNEASNALGTFSMPLWTAPELNVGAMGWGITLGNDKFGMKTPLGSLSVANDRLYGTQSISVMMEGSIGGDLKPKLGSSGLVSGGVIMKRTTTWGPNGVTTTDAPTGKATIFGQSVETLMEGNTVNKN